MADLGAAGAADDHGLEVAAGLGQPVLEPRRVGAAVMASGSTVLDVFPQGKGVPAYRADLPTTAAGMRELLYPSGYGIGHRAGKAAFDNASDVLQDTFVRPAVLAALFEAMATIHGVEVVPDAVNIVGERGVAIGFTDQGTRNEWLFDPHTYRVIGERQVRVAGGRDGAVVYTAAQLESAVVAHLRERPDGTYRTGEEEEVVPPEPGATPAP